MNPFVVCLSVALVSTFLFGPVSLAQEGGTSASSASVDMSDKGPTIDVLSVKDTDIREVIEIIAKKSGLSIVTGQNVQGRATIFLKDVDARDALRMVLEANGLAFADEGGIIRVMTSSEYLARFGYPFGQEKVTKMIRVHFSSVKDLAALLGEMKSDQGKVIANEDAKTLVIMDSAEKVRAMEKVVREVDVQAVTAEITLKYAKAQDLVDDLRVMLTQSMGTIECDTQANKLVVTDTPTRVGKIRRAIEEMDARGRHITVEAKLVHVVLNREHMGGVDWSGIVEEFRNIRLWGQYDFLDGEAEDRVLSLGVIGQEDLSTLLEAMDTIGIVKEYPLSDITLTQADAVRVVVRMDDPSLSLSRLRASDAVEGDGVPSAGNASFEFYLKLSVDGEDGVEATVIPHEQRPQQKAGRLSAHTASVPATDGKTIVIGGLIATEKIATIRKIPLMGDLPLLGFAFRFHDSSVQREEFIVFLTPKIASAANGAAKSAGNSDWKTLEDPLAGVGEALDKEGDK